MTPEGWKAIYRRRIGVGKIIYIRRYTGAGLNRAKFHYPVRARIQGYTAQELVGGIVQGDRRVIFLAEDLYKAQFSGRITTADKVVETIDNATELAIIAPDKSTREFQGVLIAYELTVRG